MSKKDRKRKRSQVVALAHKRGIILDRVSAPVTAPRRTTGGVQGACAHAQQVYVSAEAPVGEQEQLPLRDTGQRRDQKLRMYRSFPRHHCKCGDFPQFTTSRTAVR